MQSRRIYTVIGIVVLAILVIGGGISYYYQQKTPPKQVLLHMASTVTDRDKWLSYAFEGEFKKTYKAKNSASNERIQTRTTKFNGTVDVEDEGGIKFVWSHEDSPDIQKEVRRGKSNSTYFGYRNRGTKKEKTTWMRLVSKDIVSRENFSQMVKEFPKLDNLQYVLNYNKWVEGAYNLVGINDVSEKEIKDVRLAYKDLFDDYYDYPKADKSRQKRLTHLFQDNQFLTLTRNYGTESIKGVESYHYGYAVDKTKYREFWREWLAPKRETENLSQNTRRILSSVDKFKKKVNTFSGEIWVSKKHAYPTQLTVNLTVNDPSIKEISFRITMSEHNKKFPIQKPDSSQTLSESDLIGTTQGNRERENEVNALVDAFYQYSIENGEWPGSVDLRDNTGTWYAIASDADSCDPDTGSDEYEGTARGTTNIVEMSEAVTPTYLTELPHDSQAANTENTSGCTGYEVKLGDNNSRITVKAPRTETDDLSRDTNIRITR